MLNRNKMKFKNAKKEIKCKKIKEKKKQPKGQNLDGTFSEGTEKKRKKKRIPRQHKLNEGEERKVFWQLKRTFGVFEMWNEGSIYRWGGWWEWKSGLMVFYGDLNGV